MHEGIDRDTLERLYNSNQMQYRQKRNYALMGVAGYRLVECEHYLHLWDSMKRKEFDWSKLTPDERNEAMDALEDEQ